MANEHQDEKTQIKKARIEEWASFIAPRQFLVLGYFCAAVGAIAGIIAAAKGWGNLSGPHWFALGAAVILCVCQVLHQKYDATSSEKLKKQNEALLSDAAEKQERLDAVEQALAEYREAQEEILKIILWSFTEDLTSAGVIEWADSERINIYHPGREIFQLVARYSAHPAFGTKSRSLCPVDESYLAIAHHSAQGKLLKNDLPDPESNFDKYAKAMKDDFKISKDFVKNNLRMKPRSILILPIHNHRKNERIGLLCLESKRPNLFGDDKIEEAFIKFSGLSAIQTYLEYGIMVNDEKA